MFSSRAKSLLSQFWELLTSFIHGEVGSKVGLVEFADWCRLPASAVPPVCDAILARETNKVPIWRYNSRDVDERNTPVSMTERAEWLPEVFQTNTHTHTRTKQSDAYALLHVVEYRHEYKLTQILTMLAL